MYTHIPRSRDSHTLFAQLQPTIWGRISVIAAQLAPAHFLYQLCADIVVAVIQTAIIFLLQMLFITDTRGPEYNPARLLLAVSQTSPGRVGSTATKNIPTQKLRYILIWIISLTRTHDARVCFFKKKKNSHNCFFRAA